MSIFIFGFRALWSPIFIISSIIVLLLYVMIITKWGKKWDGYEKVAPKEIFFFTTGLFFIYLALGGPLDLLGHLMFSAHMVQMSLAFVIGMPLLLLGIPNWMFEKLFTFSWIRIPFQFFTKPLISLLMFNGVFSMYHIPPAFNAVKTSEVLHTIFLIILFFASVFMWWPLVNRMPSWPQLEGIKKIGYIFANGVLITPACALIIFADKPLYAAYTDVDVWMKALALCVPTDVLSSLTLTSAEIFNWLPIVEDQQLGGILMKVIQELVYGSMIAYVFVQWSKQETNVVDERPNILEPKQTGGI